MLKKIQISALLITLCLGCDTAARQQQREEARKEEVADNLKKIGEETHDKQSEQPLPNENTQDGSVAPAANAETPPASSNTPDAETKPAP